MTVKQHRLPAIAMAAGLLLAGTSTLAQAQQATPTDEENAEIAATSLATALARLQARMLSLDEQLANIRTAAIEGDPDLLARLAGLRENVMARIRRDGVDVDAALARLEELKTAYQSSAGSQAERDALRETYRNELRSINQAQNDAMKDEGLRAEKQEIEAAIGAAMVAHAPQTRRLEKELEVVEAEYNRLVRMKREAASGG